MEGTCCRGWAVQVGGAVEGTIPRARHKAGGNRCNVLTKRRTSLGRGFCLGTGRLSEGQGVRAGVGAVERGCRGSGRVKITITPAPAISRTPRKRQPGLVAARAS